MPDRRARAAARCRAIFAEAVRRADPARRVAAALANRPLADPVIVLAVGKASRAMAEGAARALGERIAGGLVVVPAPVGGGDVHALDGEVDGLRVLAGNHPRPDARSEAAGRALLAAAAAAPAGGSVLALISGGASALAVVPTPGVSLVDKATAIDRLMAAGAPIDELNAVRKHLSAIKGGRLAQAAAAPVTTLIASDVVGDDPATVGSGPTVPDPTTLAGARAVLAQRLAAADVPASVTRALADPANETPKQPRPHDRVEMIAGIAAMRAAAIEAARADGLVTRDALPDVTGDVEVVARSVAAVARAAAAGAHTGGRAICAVGAGEPTVRLPPNPGRGGRAQQLALLVARELAGTAGLTVLVAGTDGIDGTGDAAGAVVDGTTWARATDPARALTRCDAHTALRDTGALLVTGPTGVNHADLIVILADPGA